MCYEFTSLTALIWKSWQVQLVCFTIVTSYLSSQMAEFLVSITKISCSSFLITLWAQIVHNNRCGQSSLLQSLTPLSCTLLCSSTSCSSVLSSISPTWILPSLVWLPLFLLDLFPFEWLHKYWPHQSIFNRYTNSPCVVHNSVPMLTLQNHMKCLHYPPLHSHKT